MKKKYKAKRCHKKRTATVTFAALALYQYTDQRGYKYECVDAFSLKKLRTLGPLRKVDVSAADWNNEPGQSHGHVKTYNAVLVTKTKRFRTFEEAVAFATECKLELNKYPGRFKQDALEQAMYGIDNPEATCYVPIRITGKTYKKGRLIEERCVNLPYDVSKLPKVKAIEHVFL